MSDKENKDFIELNEFMKELIKANQGVVSSYEDTMTHTLVEKATMGTPCQLNITVNDEGKVSLGCIPPLYYVETSFMPVFHQIEVSIERES